MTLILHCLYRWWQITCLTKRWFLLNWLNSVYIHISSNGICVSWKQMTKAKGKKYRFLCTENKLYYEALQLAFFPPCQVPWNAVALWSLLGNDKKKRKLYASLAHLYSGLVFYIARAAWPCKRTCRNVLAPTWGWIQIYQDLSSSGCCNGDLRRVNTEQSICLIIQFW